jgi:hypothetical protein
MILICPRRSEVTHISKLRYILTTYMSVIILLLQSVGHGRYKKLCWMKLRFNFDCHTNQIKTIL